MQDVEDHRQVIGIDLRLVIQSDGKIVVVGTNLNPVTGTTTLALTRYLG